MGGKVGKNQLSPAKISFLLSKDLSAKKSFKDYNWIYIIFVPRLKRNLNAALNSVTEWHFIDVSNNSF